ncbi:MAG: sigma-54 dependent transcriptional regulator, partial [Myxococcota bacterium]
VLITGETGTGKGMLARYLHDRGGRRGGPFVEVNCAAIPTALLESELFGHERGAFTDAKSQRMGLFETAQRGSLFLDEIGSAPMSVQAKLLKAIEEKRVRRVGGSQDVEVDVQVLAATHHNLRREVRRGRFRADLYHRLNVVGIRIPPLRERGADRVRLAEQFLDRLGRSYGTGARVLTPAARRFIEDYPWPGNVRELRNQLERILLLSDDPEVDAHHFGIGRSQAPSSSIAPPPSSVPPSSRPEGAEAFARSVPASPASEASPPRLSGFVLRIPEDGMALDEIEKAVIAHALERFDGNVSRAARHLRITRQTLIYRMRKHELSVERKVTRSKR